MSLIEIIGTLSPALARSLRGQQREGEQKKDSTYETKRIARRKRGKVFIQTSASLQMSTKKSILVPRWFSWPHFRVRPRKLCKVAVSSV